MDQNRLTLYSHGAGCGCKIDPGALAEILADQKTSNASWPNLLVGNEDMDDAAVYDLGDGTALISTTDFFMPIVDDPFDFGRIAAVNALNDVYAMGGHPFLALGILGWPVKQLPAEMAAEVMRGGRSICLDLGVPLAGGHSIDSVEPFFGLCVSGRVAVDRIRRNDQAQEGDQLILTKPIGVGILSTAEKLERLRSSETQMARDWMIKPNQVGAELAQLPGVHAMTDVTGFGLLGHLLEMCEGSGVGAEIEMSQVPLLDHAALDYYLLMQCVPAATEKNWTAIQDRVNDLERRSWQLLCDPQTSGGLLISVAANQVQGAMEVIHAAGMPGQVIGKMVTSGSDDPVIRVGE